MKKRLMAITFAALMATSMMGSTVFAATDGGSVAGKTSLADANFDTDYQPQKDEYKIYCTYKNIHSWYDAIKTGVDAAVADLKDKGVTIDYEWYGPAQPDAVDQVNSIETAVGQGYDLIAVDVNQADTTAKAIDTAVDAGVKVATFGTVDVPNCKRSFFVGTMIHTEMEKHLQKQYVRRWAAKARSHFLAVQWEQNLMSRDFRHSKMLSLHILISK